MALDIKFTSLGTAMSLFGFWSGDATEREGRHLTTRGFLSVHGDYWLCA